MILKFRGIAEWKHCGYQNQVIWEYIPQVAVAKKGVDVCTNSSQGDIGDLGSAGGKELGARP